MSVLINECSAALTSASLLSKHSSRKKYDYCTGAIVTLNSWGIIPTEIRVVSHALITHRQEITQCLKKGD